MYLDRLSGVLGEAGPQEVGCGLGRCGGEERRRSIPDNGVASARRIVGHEQTMARTQHELEVGAVSGAAHEPVQFGCELQMLLLASRAFRPPGKELRRTWPLAMSVGLRVKPARAYRRMAAGCWEEAIMAPLQPSE
jgi:hypothetical protein